MHHEAVGVTNAAFIDNEGNKTCSREMELADQKCDNGNGKLEKPADMVCI